MTKTRFRALLGIWALLIVARLAVPSNGLPADVKSAVDAGVQSVAATAGGRIVLLTIWAMILVGAVGMYMTRRGAPYVFIAASLLSLAVTPLFGWYAASGWQLLFEGFAWVLSGVLFTLAVAGPAKVLFADATSLNSREDR
jgi:hypothetical protein